MCNLCINYIHDYLNLKEYIQDPRLAIRQKAVSRVSAELAKEIHKFLSNFHRFTQDHMHRICKDAMREGKRLWPDYETTMGHRLSAESVVTKAFLEECHDIRLGGDLTYWRIVLQEAGLSRSADAVDYWLGTKLVNVFLVLEGVHNDHSTKTLTDFGLPIGLRARGPSVEGPILESKDEELDDLYT
jgi:hypothetical protein